LIKIISGNNCLDIVNNYKFKNISEFKYNLKTYYDIYFSNNFQCKKNDIYNEISKKKKSGRLNNLKKRRKRKSTINNKLYSVNSKKDSSSNNNKFPKVAICTIAKNENLYIREWVEYYKNMGINKIILYDNNDKEGEKFEEVINDYINSGFVEIINIRGVVKNFQNYDKMATQGKAYHDCYYNNFKKYDWIAFFDCDEFLAIDYKYKNIFEFLNDFKEFDGVKIQWRMFGDNGNLFYEKKPVLERFLNKYNANYDRRIKSIIKCKDYDFELQFGGHSPLYKEPYMVNLKKKRVKKLKDSKAYTDLPVYINHFYSKSTEEFIKRKYKQTDPYFGDQYKSRYDINIIKREYFAYNNYTIEKENMFISLK